MKVRKWTWRGYEWVQGNYRPSSTRRWWLGWPGRIGGTFRNGPQGAWSVGIAGRGFYLYRAPLPRKGTR